MAREKLEIGDVKKIKNGSGVMEVQVSYLDPAGYQMEIKTVRGKRGNFIGRPTKLSRRAFWKMADAAT